MFGITVWKELLQNIFGKSFSQSLFPNFLFPKRLFFSFFSVLREARRKFFVVLQHEEAPRELTAQKTRTVLIVLQHEEAPREITAQKTRTVLIVLQHEEAPRELTTQKTPTVLIVLQ